MAGGDPEPLVVDQRRLHLDVAALRVLAAAEVLEDVPDHHPLRVPERRAGRDVLGEVEEVELPAEHGGGLAARASSSAGEVRRQVVRRVEGRAVDPGQLRVLLVAAPVRTREPGELDRLDRLRILQMRAAAEIGEVALRVQRDVALPHCRRARPCTARSRPRSAPRASSREISSRDHDRPSSSSLPISASIRSRSDSWIGSGNSKS